MRRLVAVEFVVVEAVVVGGLFVDDGVVFVAGPLTPLVGRWMRKDYWLLVGKVRV